MAREMAIRDWGATAVGPPETWPPLLRTQIRILLTSRFSMWMGWGPELAFFYNDAYRRDTLGVKHPWALGRPAREVWAEIWADIGPRIVRVLTTGDATWDEALLLFLERSGFREETYHTFSYSPISDVDGGIAGMLCVVSEETDRVIGERRMTTLRELAADLARIRTEPDVLAAVGTHLARNDRDLPFTMTYLFDEGGAAELAAASGIAAGHPAAPGAVEAGCDGPWPLDTVRRTNQAVTVDGLGERFGPLPAGTWDASPERAIVVPLSQQGQPEPAGVLVAGLNPYRPVDAPYRGFVDLLAGQVASAIASARAYEAERLRAESLAELDRAKTQFFSNVSHEFRTPLTLIAGPVEDALSDLDAPPVVQRQRLEIIRRNAGRLRRLVNDLLDFARIEGGRLRAELTATDLAELTRDVAVSFAPAVERAGLGFAIDCPPLDRTVHVDRDMWEKVVLNLLSNALKFTLEGRIEVGLRPVQGPKGEWVEFEVRDSGVGVAADQLPLLFQRFHRAPATAARSHEGTGIGLALVAELIRLHDGDISVASEPGRGTTFTVRLPYGAPSSAVTPAGPRESAREVYVDEALQWTARATESETTGSVRAVVGATGQASVLVVDDNPDLRAYITRLLEPFWAVAAAADGAEALDLARRRRPDLILSDVMMPRLDGFGLLRELRNDRDLSTVPVVFLSARAGEEAAIEGLDAGADDYLVKPFSALELLARVRANLELARFRNRETAWRRALVESLHDAVVVCDSAATVVEVNPAFERILGFDASGVPYKPPYPWWPDPESEPDEFRRLEQLLGQVLAEGHLHRTVPLYHRDGHRLLADVWVKAVFDGDERLFVTTFRDVTAEVAAAEREAALARLGVALAEAANVSEVDAAGLAELKAVFGAARAVVVTWMDGKPRTGWAQLDDAARAAVLASRARRETVPASTGSTCHGLAGTLDPGTDGAAVWLAFDPPRPVSGDDRALFGVLCGYVGQARRRARLFEANQAVATAMQRAILGPPVVPDRVAVRYTPAVRPLEVGGDWYDAVSLPDGRLGLVVGDCVGRGLEAATVMGQLRSACRALLLQSKAPAEVTRALDAFAEHLPGAACTTLLCAVVDTAAATVTYSAAGHVPALLVTADGTTEVLDGGGSVPLGIVADLPRPEAELALPPGASLLLYTDGLIERRGESLDVGLARLAGAACAGFDLDEEDLADHVIRTVLPATGHPDDVALVIYRQLTDPTGFAIEVSAVASELAPLRRRLGRWLADRGAGEQTITDVLVACGEAVSNAIEHACAFSASRCVRISAALRASNLVLVVEDDGPWRPALPPGDRGRGFDIMRALMDDVAVEQAARGTTVRLTKRFCHGQ